MSPQYSSLFPSARLALATIAHGVNHELFQDTGTPSSSSKALAASVPSDGANQGEIVLRTPYLTQCCFKNPEASGKLCASGYLHTQDVAVMAPDGFVQIVDPAMSPPSAPEIERIAFLTKISQIGVGRLNKKPLQEDLAGWLSPPTQGVRW